MSAMGRKQTLDGHCYTVSEAAFRCAKLVRALKMTFRCRERVVPGWARRTRTIEVYQARAVVKSLGRSTSRCCALATEVRGRLEADIRRIFDAYSIRSVKLLKLLVTPTGLEPVFSP